MSCFYSKRTTIDKFKNIEDIYEPKSILKNKRRKSIHPITISKKEQIKKNKKDLDEQHKCREAFIDKFNAELLQCGGCQELFKIGDNAIQTNCACCDKFFHCHIAGSCIGPYCSVMMDGVKHSLKYCLSCVNPYLKINIENNGKCLCKTCENHPEIPNYYKQV